MSVEAQVPEDHPMLIAWKRHKDTPEYANTRKWAADPDHVDGSLWATFIAGWQHSDMFHADPEKDET